MEKIYLSILKLQIRIATVLIVASLKNKKNN